MDALPIRNDAAFDCGDGDTAWIADNGYQCEIIDGVTVYYDGNLCDSDESDWDDPYDVTSEQYVDQYNFDVHEGMDLMVFERGGPSGLEMLDDEGTDLALVCQTTLSDPQGKLDTVGIDPLANVVSPTLSGTADLIIVILFWVRTQISVIWMREQLRMVKGMFGRTGAILHLGSDLVHFRRMRTIRSRRLRSMTNCFQMRFWPIRLFRFRRNCLG